MRLGLLASSPPPRRSTASPAPARSSSSTWTAPGTGFNDPTPATPVGGNPGTTLGAAAAERLPSAPRSGGPTMLDTNVDIRVRASFVAILDCDDQAPSSGRPLPTTWSANFANAPRQNAWYPVALANKFAGTRSLAGDGRHHVQFNSALDFRHVPRRHRTGTTASTATKATTTISSRRAARDRRTASASPARRAGLLQRTSDGLRHAHARPHGRPALGPDDAAAARGLDDQHRQPGVGRRQRSRERAELPRARDHADASRSPRRSRATTTSAPRRSVPRPSSRVVSGNVVRGDRCGEHRRPHDVRRLHRVHQRARRSRGNDRAHRSRHVHVRRRKRGTRRPRARPRWSSPTTAGTSCIPPSMGGSDDLDHHPGHQHLAGRRHRLRGAAPPANVNAALRIDPSHRAGASAQGYVRLYAPCTFNAGLLDLPLGHGGVAEPAHGAVHQRRPARLRRPHASISSSTSAGRMPPRTGRPFLRSLTNEKTDRSE